MKLFFLILCFLLMSNALSAQDTVKELFAPSRFINKTQVIKTISVQQSITNEIHVLLDSLANKTKNEVLLISTVKNSIEKILFRYWKNGKLMGSKTAHAYFINTGLQIMTQTDIENGRLVAIVGISTLKPAEFVSIRFEQMVLNKKIVLSR